MYATEEGLMEKTLSQDQLDELECLFDEYDETRIEYHNYQCTASYNDLEGAKFKIQEFCNRLLNDG